jgi:prepilin-type N-terminal cleavage/methylation domain-containing protein
MMKRRQIVPFLQTPRRRRQRPADAELTVAVVPAHELVRGFTLIELLVTVGIMGVLMAIAMPIMPRSNYALWTAQEQLLADLRTTRMDALTKGDHFRFDITSTNTYAEYRMSLVGNNWVAAGTPVRSRKLPNGVTFGGSGNSFEFNTRGLMLNPGAAATLTMTESYTGHARAITIWPSGQVTGS